MSLYNNENLLVELTQEVTKAIEKAKKIGGKNSLEARQRLSGACRKWNLKKPDFKAISDNLDQVLLKSPLDEKFLPSAYRLKAVSIYKHFGSERNPRAYVNFADQLDPIRSDEILCKDFGLNKREFRDFVATLDKVRALTPPGPSNCDSSFRISSKLRLHTNARRGQHYVTTESIAAGELIIQEKLFAASMPVEEIYRICSGCFSGSSLFTLFPCDKCCEAVFCSVDCKTAACLPDGVHARECGQKSVFKQLCPGQDSLHMMLSYTMLSRFDLNIFLSGELANIEPYNVDEYLFHQDNPARDERDTKMRQLKTINYIRSLAAFSGRLKNEEFVGKLLQSTKVALFWLIQCRQLDNIPPAQVFQLSKEIFDCLLRINVNCFDWAGSGEVLGPSLLLFSSRFNHSCKPNTEWTNLNGIFRFTAIEQIQAGQEITLDYLGRVSNFDERQIKLMVNYDLCCDCNTCQLSIYSSEQLLLACAHCRGAVYFLPGNQPGVNRCRQCGQQHSKELYDQAKEKVEHLRALASTPEQPKTWDEHQEIIDLCKEIFDELYHQCNS